jgi:hypothetical protein
MPLPGLTPAGAGEPGLLARLKARLPRGRAIPVAIAAAVLVIVVAALVLATQNGSTPPAAGSSASNTAAATPSASASSTGNLTQRQAATALGGLLAQSGTDHSDVNAAVTDVESCKDLAASARTFTKAAKNRGTLLAKLGNVPGRTALSPAMISDLTSAWQASATVDKDLAKWATSESSGCKKNSTKNPNYTASLPFDGQATAGKTAFVKRWNDLAGKYGLTKYQPSEI